MTLRAKSNVLSGFLAIAWSCAPSAWAWGGQGHRTIGAIADRLLSSAARAAVAQLLNGDLDKFGRLSTRRTLEAVSDWADEITGTPAARPRWHYDDVPICGGAPRAHYCPDGQCNTGQLKRLISVLADTHAASRDRNQAQPPADIDALALEASSLVEEAGQGAPDSWALESNNLARNVAYHYRGFACDTLPADIVVLDQEYQRQAAAIVRERVLLAGARLAALLNRILVSGGSAAQRSL